mmetsp:Transcript_26269/g.60890  ORF Transcript_26269/g.60890 Transcript_26269/m.60890 type:complete len:209 (-) Transcript_26269:1494-2120(-)
MSARTAPYASAKPLCTLTLSRASKPRSSSSSSKSDGRKGKNSRVQHRVTNRQQPDNIESGPSSRTSCRASLWSSSSGSTCNGARASACAARTGENGFVGAARNCSRYSSFANTFCRKSKQTGCCPSADPNGPVVDSSAKGTMEIRTSVATLVTLCVPRKATTRETSLGLVASWPVEERSLPISFGLTSSGSSCLRQPWCSANSHCTSS